MIRPSLESHGGRDGVIPKDHPVHGGRTGGGCIDRLIMKCISWNVRGLRDERRRGIVGRYLREWGADVTCLQETMLTNPEQRIWTSLGWGSGESQVSIVASGRSGGMKLAWKEATFDKSETGLGRQVVAARLVYRTIGSSIVIASASGPSIPSRRGKLWEDLAQLCRAFPDTPILIGGDYNVTLAADDRPNGAGGRDLGLAQFREVLAQQGLAKIGPFDQRFTWKGPSSQSRLDRFLCSIELLARFSLAEVTSLPRPLSDHTPILWSTHEGLGRPTYFKMDRSWLHDGGFKRDIAEWWHAHLNFGSASDQLITKLKDFCHHLFNLDQIRIARTRNRDIALTCIQVLDVMEDVRPLTADEIREQKTRRDEVAEANIRIKMDWRQHF